MGHRHEIRTTENQLGLFTTGWNNKHRICCNGQFGGFSRPFASVATNDGIFSILQGYRRVNNFPIESVWPWEPLQKTTETQSLPASLYHNDSDSKKRPEKWLPLFYILHYSSPSEGTVPSAVVPPPLAGILRSSATSKGHFDFILGGGRNGFCRSKWTSEGNCAG